MKKKKEGQPLVFLLSLCVSLSLPEAMALIQTTRLRPTAPSLFVVGPKSHVRPSTATIHHSSKAASPNGVSVSSRRSLRVVAKASTSESVPNIGDVTIFDAAGDPVLFKHLWDQDNVLLLYIYISSLP